MAVVVTAASGYDLDYVWKNQAKAARNGRPRVRPGRLLHQCC